VQFPIDNTDKVAMENILIYVGGMLGIFLLIYAVFFKDFDFLKNYFDAKAELIRARAEVVRPCVHNWVLIDTRIFKSRVNTSYEWKKFIYRCTKCCEGKGIDTDNVE